MAVEPLTRIGCLAGRLAGVLRMTGYDVGSSPGLVGRARECAVIDRLVGAAAGGDSGVLVVCGEAGMGKTALLGYAAARATDMRVLRATGVEAERDLAFAGLMGFCSRSPTGFRVCPNRSGGRWRRRWA